MWKKLSSVAGIADGLADSAQAVIEGVKQLVLKMTDAGDGKRADWGVRLEPMLGR